MTLIEIVVVIVIIAVTASGLSFSFNALAKTNLKGGAGKIAAAARFAYNRAVMIGTGGFINSIEGTIQQVRGAFSPSRAGYRGAGVVFFSMANANEAVAANPLSNPAGRDTPRRSFAGRCSPAW